MEENVKVEYEEEKEVLTVPTVNVVYGKVETNFAEFKEAIAKRVAFYSSLILTEDNVKTIEEARATLNKTAKQINDYRIAVEKEFNKPFAKYKDDVKDVTSLLSKASEKLDVQIKEYEQKVLNEKKAKVLEIYNELVNKSNFRLLSFEMIYNRKWENKGFKLPDIEKDLEYIVLKAKEEIGSLYGLADDNRKNVIVGQYLSNATYDSINSGICFANTVKWFNESLAREKAIEKLETKVSDNPDPVAISLKEEIVEEKRKELRLDLTLKVFNVNKEETVELCKYLKSYNIEYTINK